MAQQQINVGTVANDGTGDPLRDAFVKANDNFDELYAADAALATVATTGAYADLSGKPVLGTAAATAATDYATAAQGATADTALQPAGNGSALTGLTKTQVGLANVDNTSDANKPVSTATQTALDAKQATLVSATNIKTINGGSVLGSGDLVVAGAAAWGSVTGTLSNQTDLQTALDGKQAAGSYATGTGTANGTNTGDQTLPVKATGAELDTGTDDAKFATAKALKDSHNVPSVAPGTSGNLLTSNGTDWTSAAQAELQTTCGVGASPSANGTQTITHGLGRTPKTIRIYGLGNKQASTSASNDVTSFGLWCSSGNANINRVQGTAAGQASSTAFAIKVGSGASAFCSGVIGNVGATTFDIVWTESGTSDTTPVYLWEAQ